MKANVHQNLTTYKSEVPYSSLRNRRPRFYGFSFIPPDLTPQENPQHALTLNAAT